MKRDFLILAVLLVCALGTSAWGYCPQDTLDRGTCDSIYIEPWAPDIADTAWERTGVHIVRVPIYITADIAGAFDSISGFCIPLCYTHNTNLSKYCSVSTYWNEVLYTPTKINRNILRHMPDLATATVHNWMMDLYDLGEGAEWSTVSLDLDGTSHFWLIMIASGSEDQRFIAGSRILIATMTMKLEDTMNICIDTCFWPPSSRLAFTVNDQDSYAKTKIPRSGTGTSSFQVCFPHGSQDVREIEENHETHPTEFSLSQNYPNPFNPVTNFQFRVSQATHVKIDLYNIVGQRVKTLVDEDMKPGVYSADWNGTDESGKSVSSGLYFYKMQAGEFSAMKKMVLLK